MTFGFSYSNPRGIVAFAKVQQRDNEQTNKHNNEQQHAEQIDELGFCARSVLKILPIGIDGVWYQVRISSIFVNHHRSFRILSLQPLSPSSLRDPPPTPPLARLPRRQFACVAGLQSKYLPTWIWKSGTSSDETTGNIKPHSIPIALRCNCRCCTYTRVFFFYCLRKL